jgi:hypothetical protein
MPSCSGYLNWQYEIPQEMSETFKRDDDLVKFGVIVH